MLWLGTFGPIAVGYAVFQALVGLLPDALYGDTDAIRSPWSRG
ncbi:hypothetical protein SALBM135S_07733 [Streptomyces alboniger]